MRYTQNKRLKSKYDLKFVQEIHSHREKGKWNAENKENKKKNKKKENFI